MPHPHAVRLLQGLIWDQHYRHSEPPCEGDFPESFELREDLGADRLQALEDWLQLEGEEENQYPMGRRECLYPRMREECPLPRRRGEYPYPKWRVSLSQDETRVSLSQEERRLPEHLRDESPLPCTTNGEGGPQIHLS